MTHKSFSLKLIRIQVGIAFVMLLFTCVANAQTGPTDGMTPSGMAPGNGAGSYGLSGFDNVNLYNGNLNFALPLVGVGGRGGAQRQMTLKLDSAHWQVEHETIDGYESYWVNPNTWDGIRPGYGPGVLQARSAVVPVVMNPHSKRTLMRLTFTAADGTEYELVDTYPGGNPIGPALCSENTRSRGTVFSATTALSSRSFRTLRCTTNATTSGRTAMELVAICTFPMAAAMKSATER